MTTIWVIPIEPLDSRFSKQWYNNIPNILASDISKQGLPWKVMTIPGKEVEGKTSGDAFLDFGNTNFYKGTQTANISHQFSEGRVKAGDKFLVTDAWNFNITAIRYMSELFEVPVEIHSIWHSGSYDPTDIYGKKLSSDWASLQEKTWFHASDYNYFGTEFHRQMFLKNLKIQKKYHKKAIRSGQPYREVAQACMTRFDYEKKDNIVVFPHRLSDEKQPEIFRDLVQALPNEWGYVLTHDDNFTKEEFYNVLGQSKMVFSSALHENFGTGMMEGTLCGCIPVVPDRASYGEIYQDMFRYPSDWTKDWDSYLVHKDELVAFMSNLMESYDELLEASLLKQTQIIIDDFMYPESMLKKLLTITK